MRLRDIKSIIDKYNNSLKIQLENIPNDSSNYRLKEIRIFQQALKAIEKTELFKSDIEEIKKTEALILSTDISIVLSRVEASKVNTKISNLITKLINFSEGISYVLPEQSENSISIKLPKTNNLKELIETSNRLDKIFNQLLSNKYIDEKVDLQNFDTGSEWIEIVFGTVTGLWIFTKIVHAVILIERELLKNKDLKENIKLKAITNSAYENILKQMEELTIHDVEIIKNKEINEIMNKLETSKEKDNEYYERIKFSIDETRKLINKGMQFFPSSVATQDVKDTLPDFTKDLEHMIPNIEQIENKNN